MERRRLIIRVLHLCLIHNRTSVGRQLLSCLLLLMLFINGCIYIEADSVLGPPSDSAPTAGSRFHTAPIARIPDLSPVQQLRVLGMNDTATVLGRQSETSTATPLFDLTVIAYEFADHYANPMGGIERPPPGTVALFILAHATNVTRMRGRPPFVTVTQGDTILRGCLIAHDRANYDVLSEVFPDESVEGWLCRIVPMSASVREIGVRADGRIRVYWQLEREARAARQSWVPDRSTEYRARTDTVIPSASYALTTN